MYIKAYTPPQKIIATDIETGGTEPDSAIFSSSVTTWTLQSDNIHYALTDYFHDLVCYTNNDERVLTRNTMNWHFNDRRTAYNPSLNVSAYHREVAPAMGNSLRTHLLLLAKYYMRTINEVGTRNVAMYANGPEFDHVILNHALSQNCIDFHLNPFRARSVRNAMDFAGACMATNPELEKEILRRRENDIKIEYAPANFYVNDGFRKVCTSANLQNCEPSIKDLLPPEELHCSLYDAELEGRLAVFYHEHLNKKVVNG